MAGEKTELLTLEQAAAAAGVSVQTFRLYVASGNVKAEKGGGEPAVFDRTAAERVGALQREAVEQARHLAVEKLSAELVVMRESLLDTEQLRDTLANLERSLAEQSRFAADDSRAMRDETAVHARELEAMRPDLKETRRQVGELRDAIAGIIEAGQATTDTLEAQNRLLLEQAQVIEGLRAEQMETRQRINHLLDRLADAFFQVRSEPVSAPPPTAAVQTDAKPQPKPAAKKVEPTPGPQPKPESKRETEPAPQSVPQAKVGVIREIEFNYLMERMGYRRLDSYTPEELEDESMVRVPDDEAIRQFLSVHELGCDLDEVEISVITRGDWQMMQYQRAAKKNGKRAWIGGR